MIKYKHLKAGKKNPLAGEDSQHFPNHSSVCAQENGHLKPLPTGMHLTRTWVSFLTPASVRDNCIPRNDTIQLP